MNNQVSSVSPRGFALPGARFHGTVTTGVADPEIQHLRDLLQSREVNPSTWPYRKKVLEAAVRLIGHWPSWVQMQYANPYLYGRNFEFFEDTLVYLKTGRRRMGVRAWTEMLEENPSSAPQFTRRRPDNAKIPDFSVQGRNDTASVLAAWCQKPRGLEDLLLTLTAMYGVATDLGKK